ncbi:MAG: DUF6273 domain-containing protein [Eubacteriales bacterium]|nr:DUF6273 domain-containing protein [Eubacteriales bacterium]
MASAGELHYLNGKKKLETIEVLIQPEDIARTYREAAKEMDAAQGFEDSRRLAKEYRETAAKTEKEGRERLYQKACAAMDAAQQTVDYKLAIDMFERVKGYKDADERALKCRAKSAAAAKRRDARTACIILGMLAAFLAVITFVISSRRESTETANVGLEDAAVGSEVTFGPYTWRVLERADDTALLVMTHADYYEETSNVTYNDTDEAVTWADSTLRAWLNSEFLEGFEEEDRAKILLSEVKNSDNEVYGTEGGEDTQDYVYLMSLEDTETYADQISSFSLNWLLRSPGKESDTVAYMTTKHRAMAYGCPVTWDSFDIRPVLRVSLQAD